MPTDDSPQNEVPRPSPEEIAQKDAVMERVVEFIRSNQTIRLPDFDPANSAPSPSFALQSIVCEANPFGGTLGPFGYQFEGEEDLLHLFVCRPDGVELSVRQAQRVFQFLMPEVPPALVWLKPGVRSQHFYFGHDVLL